MSRDESKSAETFATSVIAALELFRRKHRNDVGLVDEIHEVHTSYQEVGSVCCKHCQAWTQLSPPVRYDQGPHLRECSHCGDKVVFRFYLAPGP